MPKHDSSEKSKEKSPPPWWGSQQETHENSRIRIEMIAVECSVELAPVHCVGKHLAQQLLLGVNAAS